MLRRQKTILALLSEAKQPLTPTMLVKYAFLLRHETDVSLDPAFYDFVPYKFGPFSFALYRELEALQRDGYVAFENDRFLLSPDTFGQSLEKVAELSAAMRSSVRAISKRYGKLGQRTLLKSVYGRYPHYASKSELTDLQSGPRPEPTVARPAVYTAGYEQKSVDGFFDDLLKTGIRVVIDVRSNPVSRKYGFARSSMAGIAQKLDLDYIHLPTLGIPSQLRIGLGSKASYKRLLDAYERNTLPERTADVGHLARKMERSPCVLVCMERDVECCHRSRLATAVSSANGLPVRHL